jgi:hypothetical protein
MKSYGKAEGADTTAPGAQTAPSVYPALIFMLVISLKFSRNPHQKSTIKQ